MLYPPHAALMITMLAPSWSGVEVHSALGIILLSMAAAMPFSGRPASAIRAERVVAWVSLGVLLIVIFIFSFLFLYLYPPVTRRTRWRILAVIGGLSEEVIDGAVAFAYVVISARYDGLADVFLCPFG